MSHISLIVKGTRAQSMTAALFHGIKADFKSHCLLGECVLWADVRYRPQVVDWFLEDPINAPYPFGTLLLYSQEED